MQLYSYFRASLMLPLLLFQVDAFKFSSTLGHIKPKRDAETQAMAVVDLIRRTIPDRAAEFSVIVTPIPDAKDSFQIEKLPTGIIQLTGTTGVAAASAFHHYLKYFCNCHISWEASQLNLPEVLPEVNVTVTLNDQFRYYQNVCTTSYSFVWWSWQQWEKHIDWMALNSFNLVLAFNGQEAIWRRVYQRFNLTDTDIEDHISGPAFLSWLRMGNIVGWGGPLTESWQERSLLLQKQILERMRSFGMIPVLPGFAGHIPKAFRSLYPDVEMIQMGAWNDFSGEYCCPYFLEPTEELFNEIGTAFIEEQIAEYGTDHVYNCDSFNENTPISTNLTYLANVGKSIYKAMTDADPDAIWMLQGWAFYYDEYWNDTDRVRALLTSIPLGKMVVLDLQSEQFPQYGRLSQYFGQPYIWCMLHNFGGTLGMFGSSSIINTEPITAREAESSTMIGTGLTPEGINQNYVIYDLMTETAWRTEPANLTEWFRNYTIRRYGLEDEDAVHAWEVLQKSVYDFNSVNRIRGQYAITRTPSFSITTWYWYTTDTLVEAWSSLLKAADTLEGSAAYLHDIVDLSRQVLQVYGDVLYTQLVKDFKKKDTTSFQNTSDTYLDVLNDLESILAASEDFLLGTWLRDAKAAANNGDDRKLFEYNARNQITLWGPRGEIMNYAIKQWSGVASKFLEPRWRLFLEYANDCLMNETPFNQSVIKQTMFEEVEEPFTFDDSEFPVEATGSAVDIARKLYEKWGGFGLSAPKWGRRRRNRGPVAYFRSKNSYFAEPGVVQFG